MSAKVSSRANAAAFAPVENNAGYSYGAGALSDYSEEISPIALYEV